MTNIPEDISNKIASFIYRGWGSPCKYYYGFIYDSKILNEDLIKPLVLLVYQTYKFTGVTGNNKLLFFEKDVKCRLALVQVNGENVDKYLSFKVGSVSRLENIYDFIIDDLDGQLLGQVDFKMIEETNKIAFKK